MLASIELKHKTSDLARVYRLLEQRIDGYLTMKDDCYHEASSTNRQPVRSVQKTLFRAMREREMKNLRAKIVEHNQQIYQNYSLMGRSDGDRTLCEDKIAEHFLTTYQLIWDCARKINKLNQHKGQTHASEGKFANCLYDLLTLMESELINNRNARLGNYFITERYLGIIAHHRQDLRAATK